MFGSLILNHGILFHLQKYYDVTGLNTYSNGVQF